jgi:hypothetical protein
MRQASRELFMIQNVPSKLLQNYIFSGMHLFDKLIVFLLQIDELLSYGINVTVYNGQVSITTLLCLVSANRNY